MDEETLFRKAPIGKALANMILPTIISQVISVIYNMADTWYVGLTGSADAVAAVSLCLSVYSMLSAISNLFGIGGAAVLARALGVHHGRQARGAMAFSLAGALGGAALYSLLIAVLGRPILLLIGADSGTLDYAWDYVRWTIVAGGIPTILSPVCAHLLRSMGRPRTASLGMMLGAGLNILLDPLWMFVLLPAGQEVKGAAIATALSNLAALVFFVFFLHNAARKTFSNMPASPFKPRGRQVLEIMEDGIPGFCMVALSMVSNCVLNSMISTLGSAAVAGIGIVRKIDQLAYAVNQGITQGMLPLAAYCWSAGLHRRMWKAVKLSALCSEGFSLVCSAISLLFARQLVTFFIRDEATIHYGAEFLRVLCLAIPIYTLTFVIIALFQGVGRGVEPLILSILHKGSLDIVLLFLIRPTLGVERLVWAAPISETVALAVGAWMLLAFRRSTKQVDLSHTEKETKG